MRFYISGPMRGRRGFNFPAFVRAAEDLTRAGYEVLSPAQRDMDNGFDPKGLIGFEDLSKLGFDLREALLEDCRMICEEADAIVVLDGWAFSKGAKAEVALGRALGLPVLTYVKNYNTGRVDFEELM